MATGPNRSGGDYGGLALVSTAVAEMVLPILAGVWADRRFDSAPFGLVIGAVVGLVGGFAHLVYVSRRRGGTAGG